MSTDWRAALEALPMMAWLADASGTLLFANRCWREYTGLDALATPAFDSRQAIHPDDYAATQAAWLSSVVEGTPYTQTLRLRRHDGVYQWYISRAQPILDAGGHISGWSGTSSAIEGDQQAEPSRNDLLHELQLERARLRSIVDNVPVGLIFADNPSGKIVGGNAQAEQILGHALLPSPNVASYREWEGYHADGRRVEGHEYPLARALQGEVSSADVQYRRGDGNMVWIRVSGAPMRDANGTITGGVIMFLDIDAENRARDEQALLLQSERMARAEAEAAVAERDAFIASVTHDLKNPLTVIRGQVEMLRRRAPDPATEEGSVVARRLNHIEQTVLRMVTQIDELIDVARLRVGQTLDLQQQQVDIIALLERVTSGFAATTSQHEIVWQPDTKRLMGVWDESRLERVFSNLLSNAIKYSPNGGMIAVHVEQEHSGGGRWVCVSVSDQGVGIPAADLPAIFELYARSEAHAALFSGAGVGLANARNIVQQHGGNIEVSSVEGSGSRFVVRLPLPK